MINIFVTTLIVFISTSIDYIFLLFLIFNQVQSNTEKWQVVWGHYLGIGLLVAISLLLTLGLSFVPQDWVIGLLGLIPIYMGINYWLNHSDQVDDIEIKKQMKQRNGYSYLVLLITVVSGGDNIGVYVPYFLSLSGLEIIQSIFYLHIFVGILLYLSYRLTLVDYIATPFKKIEYYMIPAVYILLGFYILASNGTISKLMEIIRNIGGTI